MFLVIHKPNDFFPNWEISFFVCGEKTEFVEKRHDSLLQWMNIRYFVIHDAVRSFPKRPASELFFNEGKNYSIFLRDIKWSGYFPVSLIIITIFQGNIKTSFSVSKTCDIVAESRLYIFQPIIIHFFDVAKPFLLIACVITLSLPNRRSASSNKHFFPQIYILSRAYILKPGFPAFSKIFLRNYNVLSCSIVTADIHQGL